MTADMSAGGWASSRWFPSGYGFGNQVTSVVQWQTWTTNEPMRTTDSGVTSEALGHLAGGSKRLRNPVKYASSRA